MSNKNQPPTFRGVALKFLAGAVPVLLFALLAAFMLRDDPRASRSIFIAAACLAIMMAFWLIAVRSRFKEYERGLRAPSRGHFSGRHLAVRHLLVLAGHVAIAGIVLVMLLWVLPHSRPVIFSGVAVQLIASAAWTAVVWRKFSFHEGESRPRGHDESGRGSVDDGSGGVARDE